MKIPSTWCALTLPLMLAVGACDGMPGKPSLSDIPKDPRTIVDAHVLYAKHCAGCHGADGRLGAARPLNDPLYLAFVGQERFAEIVDQGVSGKLMPAFGTTGLLSDAQREALVAGIYEQWAGPHGAGSLPPYEVAAVTGDELKASVARGAQVFADRCTTCHEEASEVTDPAFLALVSRQSLRSTVVCGRPDLDKPDWRGKAPGQALSFQQITDVTNWLISHRTAFAGQPSKRSAQERIHQDD